MAIKDIYEGVLAFQVDKVKELTQAEMEAGTDIPTILNEKAFSLYPRCSWPPRR